MSERSKEAVLKTAELKGSVGSNPTPSATHGSHAFLRYHGSMTQPTIKCWHGSQRWTGFPEVQPVSKGRYESGPGIYLTTRRQRASEYARGAGSLVMIEIDPNVRLLENAWFTREQMQDALDSLPRLRRRKEIEKDLDRSLDRHPDGVMPAIYLVNLCVNHEALTGDNGPALARWLVQNGVDASLDHKGLGEDWMVVFNPKVIVKSRKLTAAQADEYEWEMPLILDQIAAINPEAPKSLFRRPSM